MNSGASRASSIEGSNPLCASDQLIFKTEAGVAEKLEQKISAGCARSSGFGYYADIPAMDIASA
jgi:hypothetical protein